MRPGAHDRATMSRRELLAGLTALGLSGCKVEQIFNHEDIDDIPVFTDCDIDTDFIVRAAARDAIFALDAPRWVRAHQSVPEYLEPNTRVMGVHSFGQPWAVPLNVLWQHEVLNLDPGGPLGPSLAVTHCPLTGSSRVLDRSVVGGAPLGVSGLLFMNNLMVFDRTELESAWPQMTARAGCGARLGEALGGHPFIELNWAQWVNLYPETYVPTGDQGFTYLDGLPFDYTDFGYPYGPYRTTEPFWRPHAMPAPDTRRFSKEVVIGVPSEPGWPGIAFPHGALKDRDGPFQVVDFTHRGGAAVLLWSDQAEGGMPFWPTTDKGTSVTMRATPAGFEDEETGSSWSVDGAAISGPLAGERLVGIPEAYTAYWRAWAAFNPDTRLWE